MNPMQNKLKKAVIMEAEAHAAYIKDHPWTIAASQDGSDGNVYTGDQLWEDGERPHFRTEQEAQEACDAMIVIWRDMDANDKPWGTPEFEVVNFLKNRDSVWY